MSKLKLAIDLTYQPFGGSLSQIKELINNVNVYDFDKVVFFTTKDNLHLFKGIDSIKIELKIVRFSNKSIVIRTLWSQIILPILLVLNNISVLFCTGNISPIICSRKKVQWIGTVGPFVDGFIGSFSWRHRFVLFVIKYLTIFSAFTSDLVIFESFYTRGLFVSKYGQKDIKSATFHIGIDDYFYPVEKIDKVNGIDCKNIDFILTVSHLYPYKNIEILIESFYELKLHEDGLYLLIAGSLVDDAYYDKLQLMAKKLGISKFIIFLGRVEKQNLRELYSMCKVFVFTSPYENFAYTLVEAMSCGSPIITTDTTAMPETCGDAALYFQPGSKKQLSDHLLTYLSNEDTRKKFKGRSLRKSNEYENYALVNRRTNSALHALTL